MILPTCSGGRPASPKQVLRNLIGAGLCGIGVLALGGCAKDATPSAQPVAAAGQPRPARFDPALPPLQSAYEACLAQAARFADDGHSDVGRLALVVAPMCHPQFSRIEDQKLASADYDTREALERGFDPEQIKSASEALREERQQARMAAMPSELADGGRQPEH